MKKFINLLILSTSFILFICLVSCDKNDEELRTPEIEKAEIENYIQQAKARNVVIDTIENGLYAVVINHGKGPVPQIGDECTVTYRGYLINRTKIEDSYLIFPDGGKWTFKFKPTHAVEGLIKGIGIMRKGSEFEFLISSDLAYGSKGANAVSPYSALIYHVKMENIVQDE